MFTAFLSFEAAIEELLGSSGRDFDPTLVRMFAELLREDADLRTRLMELRGS